MKAKEASSYTHNPLLPYMPGMESYPGSPLDHSGRFVNLEFPYVPKFSEVLKWQSGPRPQKDEKKRDKWRVRVISEPSFLSSTDDVIVWLGHASFFIRIHSIQILIDPVFGSMPFTPRFSAFPIDPNLFRNIDYILISHDHRDHCDEDSIKLLARNNPEAVFLTGLHLDSTLKGWVRNHNIQAAGWYQQYLTDMHELRITYMPSRHWARRNLTDTNNHLWGAFAIQAGGKTIYFSGDSGYGSHFKEAGEMFPDIDVCIIGIGAYSPRWFMSPNHIDPENAVKAFAETGARRMLPMHYGTFDLSDEPMGEPPLLVQKAFNEQMAAGELLLPAVGEKIHF